MPASSASSVPSVVDLLGGISTAAWTALTLGTSRFDQTPGLRSFAGAWAAIALHLLVRPGASSGHPGLMVADVLTGAAAGALLLHGASAWESDVKSRAGGNRAAYALFAASCALQSTITLVDGPEGAAVTSFRTMRLFVVASLAFFFTRSARSGESLSARAVSWTFGVLAVLSGLTAGLEGTSMGTPLSSVLNATATLSWTALALSMAGYLLEERTHRRATRTQADSDEITGLTRRAPFEAQLESAIVRAGERREGLAVAFLDLDRFRTLNESMGHSGGDAVLLEVADRLRQTLPPGALAARVGGDEFVAVWPGVTDPSEAIRLATELSQIIAAPMQINHQDVLVTATAGVSLFPKDAADAATM